MSARQIIRYLLSAPSTEDRWTCAYHIDQSYPLPAQFDWLSGTKLRNALQQIGDEQGITFTLMGADFNLVWARKGEGVLPIFPPNSDDRTSGISLTDNPTRIEILGDRNVYQVLNIPMEPDWARAWERYFDPMLFMEEVYQVGQLSTPLTIGTQTFAAGTTFRAVGAHKVGSVFTDPEQIISRQLAMAAANEITVGEYAALKGDTSYLDYRKFAGRSRLDMPAMLYLQQILFRAFRFPDGFYITNANGRWVPIMALSPAGKMIAKVTHDPISGIMECDLNEGADGSGYAIVRGYQVTQDLFKTIRPERFNSLQWKQNAANVWEHIEFQVDDSGEGDPYILFDAPVIRSDELLTEVDGYATVKMHTAVNTPIAFTIPDVRLALTFEAERLSYVHGRGPRDDVQVYPGLNAEFIADSPFSAPTEVAYADGTYAMGKAADLAESLLCRQIVLSRGKSTRPLNPGPDGKFAVGTQLTSMMDRIELGYSTGGCLESVFLTSEYPRQTYTPERDLDRGAAMRQLLPGQAELRHFANIAKLTASALAASPDARKLASEAYQAIFGTGEIPVQAHVAPPSDAQPRVFVRGTVFSRAPTTVSGSPAVASNTSCVIPSDSTNAHSEFDGVTVRHNEQVGADGGNILLQRDGDILAQVMGPVAVGDYVGLSPGNGYLVKDATPTVGKVLRGNSDNGVAHLIKVRTSSVSAPSAGYPFEIVAVTDSTAKVSLGYALNGLDAKEKPIIFGLDTVFGIWHDSIVYLEICFDKNLSPFLFNICCAPNDSAWDTEAYPNLVRTAKGTDDPRITESSARWVIPIADPQHTFNYGLATEKFAAFDTKWRCWKTFLPIGHSTTASGITGVGFTDSVTAEAFTVVQQTDTNLMLAQFCDNGVPALVPIPFAGPIMEPLPSVQVTLDLGYITLAVPGHSGASIYYTFDGSDPTTSSTQYLIPFPRPVGDATIKAIATLQGYYPSAITTAQV